MKESQDLYCVSVIVPTYNRSKLLDYTLNSLVLQSMPKSNFEVVVADDGSTDNTLEVVEKYRERLNLKYVFQEDKGYRPASARNAGIRAAEGKVVVMVDSGVILNTNCLEAHYDLHIEKGPKVVAIGYVYGFDQGDGMMTVFKRLLIPEEPADSIKFISKDKMFYDVRDYHYTTYQDNIQDLPAPWYYFWTCHLSVSREQLLSVGLFDEQYDGKWGCEDNDLGLRLHMDGGKYFVLRKAQSIHYPHESNMKDKVEQGYQNCIYFHNKFPTAETKLFLETYRNEIFTDINAILMRTKWFEKVS